ncbi:MAG: fasciclin domain-containing protein [Pseudomonadota bacterium]
MRNLILSTAMISLIAAPGALADPIIDAEVDALPVEYSTEDLNKIVLARLDDQTAYAIGETPKQPMITEIDTDVSKTTIIDAASNDERFSTLATLVTEAGLVDALEGTGPYTVFAPTNEAFAALPAEKVEYLRSDEGRDDLVNILKAHVVTGKVLADDIPTAGLDVRALNNERLDITTYGETVEVEGAEVVIADITVDNGVIHAIDQVIIPTEG